MGRICIEEVPVTPPERCILCAPFPVASDPRAKIMCAKIRYSSSVVSSAFTSVLIERAILNSPGRVARYDRRRRTRITRQIIGADRDRVLSSIHVVSVS